MVIKKIYQYVIARTTPKLVGGDRSNPEVRCTNVGVLRSYANASLQLAMTMFIVFANVAIVFAQTNARIIEGLSMNSIILGQEVKYSIILPEDYFVSKKSYPVVYLLHGLGDNESSWLEYGRVSQVADKAVGEKQIIPMIFVMPQGYRNYYVNEYTGKFLYEDMFIKELVPFIDKQYRTLADKEHRATLGYSMGGFGALVLPLRNPDVFTISVPLSISVRTDEQYKTEDASGWDDQWGRLFGGVGTTGNDRITEYYKQHSPFHLFAQKDLQGLKNLKLYIDNGDDEETLCRSNEELHMLLRDKNFPHEFRVRNGGHEFVYWRDALPNGLRFISDALEGKPYRGDLKSAPAKMAISDSKIIDTDNFSISFPVEYAKTQRYYPVIYFLGDFESETKKAIASKVQDQIQEGNMPPVIVVFLKKDEEGLITTIIPKMEKEYRARTGFRFRSLIGFEKGGMAALRYAVIPETFTSCVIFDASLDCDLLKKARSENEKVLARTWLFMATTDKSLNYQGNGCAHMFLRDKDVYHEYRVQEGMGGKTWFVNNLTEALNFTQRKIHR